MVIIGIVSSYDRHDDLYVVPKEYVKAIMKTGAVPILIPYLEDNSRIQKVSDLADGLLLIGGGDVHPVYYGEEPSNIYKLIPERDLFELKIIEAFFEKGKPILGICRGCQILNIFFGGSLTQEINTGMQHWQDAEPHTLFHSIQIKKDSKLFEIIKKTEIMVNSFHHQAISKIGEGLEIVAWAKDGTPEAIEWVKDGRFILGVQFHIEGLYEKHSEFFKIFEYFITETKIKRKVKDVAS